MAPFPFAYPDGSNGRSFPPARARRGSTVAPSPDRLLLAPCDGLHSRRQGQKRRRAYPLRPVSAPSARRVTRSTISAIPIMAHLPFSRPHESRADGRKPGAIDVKRIRFTLGRALLRPRRGENVGRANMRKRQDSELTHKNAAYTLSRALYLRRNKKRTCIQEQIMHRCV
jgi:hypothetical protein